MRLQLRRFLRSAFFLAALLATAPSLACAQLPSDARWRVFDTPHFRVHYTEGLEALARRAGDRAETAWAEVSRTLVRPPRGRVELVLADNVDFANGYATPFPTNRVVVYAHPPVDDPTLAFYDDWLQLVITHELTHTFHLDYAGGIWRPLRSVFGRSPFLFPSATAPSWVTEGLATYLESRLTRAGRVRGTMHDMVLRTAILEDAFFPIDRASGDPATWPGGSTRYVYGSLFVHHLAERYGPERVGRFIRAAGGALIPYRMNAAARRAFGVSFTRAWREWERELRGRYLPLADSLRAAGLTEPEELTREGRFAQFPRFSPDGASIAYAASTGREEPATRLLVPGGGERELAPRTTLGPASWIPGTDALLFAQLDFRDPYRVFSDLYRVDGNGERVRLTRGARIADPHPSPDGRRAVAVQGGGGTNVPVVVELATGEVRPLAGPSLDVHWALPRWSPRGDRIAVGRWRAGGFYDVVVMDTTGRVVRELTHDRAVDDAPAWSPDGRYVVFASDRTGISDLYTYDFQAGRLLRVTRVLTGAFQPEVSPDGQWIVFSHYRSDGYHLARIPFDPATWLPVPVVRPEVAGEGADPARFAATAGGPDRGYSPWPGIAPSSWLPVFYGEEPLGTALGASVFGEDVAERHGYAAYAALYPEGGRLDGELAYRYQGWGVPVLDLSASQEWTAFRGVRDASGNLVGSDLLERDRLLRAGLTFPRPRYRSFTWLSAGADARKRDREWVEPGVVEDDPPVGRDLPLDLGGTLTAGYSTVRGYAFSISAEDGFLLSGTAEGRHYTRAQPGQDAATGYLRLTGR
ncbi:MAG TPA: hypothetical protein VHG28_18835, partial [Longimicrobiaceae bacterium]|nr:hypothetical protein [Longimicrobiaceae bacterium]